VACVICDDICADVSAFFSIRNRPICEACAYAILGEMLREIVEVRVK